MMPWPLHHRYRMLMAFDGQKISAFTFSFGLFGLHWKPRLEIPAKNSLEWPPWLQA